MKLLRRVEAPPAHCDLMAIGKKTHRIDTSGSCTAPNPSSPCSYQFVSFPSASQLQVLPRLREEAPHLEHSPLKTHLQPHAAGEGSARKAFLAWTSLPLVKQKLNHMSKDREAGETS